jgi:hypothetical protein
MSVKSELKAAKLKQKRSQDKDKELVTITKKDWLNYIADMKYEFNNELNNIGNNYLPDPTCIYSYHFIVNSIIFAFGLDRLVDITKEIKERLEFIERKAEQSDDFIKFIDKVALEDENINRNEAQELIIKLHREAISTGLHLLKNEIEAFENFKPTINELINRSKKLAIKIGPKKGLYSS